MSARADWMRDRRRAFAAPGGAHDQMVRRLASGLPAMVGVIVAVMVITPLFPRSEVSFLLDRNKVAITTDRLKVSNATYRGADDRGKPFLVTAGAAVQHSAGVPELALSELTAVLKLEDGEARVSAPSGTYFINRERVVMAGPVRFEAPDGFRLETSGVAVDLKSRRVFGEGGVSGAVPSGNFSADRVAADLGRRAVSLDGHARLRMTQGRFSLPH